jgi:hypothetical protein
MKLFRGLNNMNLSDRIIAAAIDYQRACARYQAMEVWTYEADLHAKSAFEKLVRLAQEADCEKT